MEGMKTVNAKITALLHPSRAADVVQGVHEILNSLLLRFNEEFEGVILAYQSPRIVGHTAKILSGLSPYFHVNLTVKVLLFSPAPGMTIEGKVIAIDKDYIGVLVLGLFNSIIGVMDIRDDLNYIAEHGGGTRAWVSTSDNRHKIQLGSLIRFSVKSLQESQDIIDICGSLVEEKTGCVDWLEQDSFTSKRKLRPSEREEKKHKRKSKKERVHDGVQELKKHPQDFDQSQGSPNRNSEPEGKKHKRKSKKEQGHDGVQELKKHPQEFGQSQASPNRYSEPEGKKHKKSKKERGHDGAQELKKHPQEFEQSQASPKNDSVKGGVENVMVKHKKEGKEGEPHDSNHKSKRKKTEGLVSI